VSAGVRVRQTSPAVHVRLPCNEASGNFADVSGNTRHTVVGASNSGAYGNAGWMSTTAVGTILGGAHIPAADMLWDLRYDVVLFAFSMIAAASATSRFIMGNGATGAFPGVQFQVNGSDHFRLQLNRGSNSNINLDSLDVTGVEQHIVCVVDGPSAMASVYSNGVVHANEVSTAGAGSGAGTGTSNWGFGFGGNSSTTVAEQFRNFQMYKKTGAPGALANPFPNLAALAVRMNAAPFERLTAAEVGV